ncbi:MAG: C4-type zinc ribbon domain-containing protein [Endomicrobium sp.]|jgi:predicted  nucleic acid-binding Zn-ribbon protein|nr:C4-type zinc ribbon domain-containing protein [Endomicrobium sp.]
MENLKQDLEILYGLQNYDIKILKIKSEIENAPAFIAEQKLRLENKKSETETAKKNYVSLNSLKKEKEALLDSKEKAIAKHSMELNAVKSNDAYKALILEIEKAKADKSVIEDEILELMEKIDEETVKVKKAESELKEYEQKINAEINGVSDSLKAWEEEIVNLEKERREYKGKVNPKILEQYERVREGRDGQGIVLIDGDACGGCAMVLRPQLINQAQKCTELVFCDNCSRILLKR